MDGILGPRRSALAGLSLIVMAVMASPAALAQSTNLLAGGDSVFVTYDNGSNGPEAGFSPTVNLGFDDSSSFHPAIMDTGSTGIIASPDVFKPGPDSKNLGPGRQILSSSGKIEVGTWYTATENIYDAGGKIVATADVPVLQVTRIECQANARNCTPDQHPKHVALMGIGFAREPGSSDPSTHTPAYNAFLNLTSVAGAGGKLVPLPADWHNGYKVTPTGIDLGLTESEIHAVSTACRTACEFPQVKIVCQQIRGHSVHNFAVAKSLQS